MSGAGCPRDTHPFAALPQGGLPLPGFPLDLHVLSTPPAFVLSQDQTLRRDRFIRPEGRVGVLVWKVDLRDRHVPRVSCVACTTVCRSDAANRALPADGENALAFGTLFSSQGASDTQQGLTPKRGAAPTPYGMQGEMRRQPSPEEPGTAVDLALMVTATAAAGPAS